MTPTKVVWLGLATVVASVMFPLQAKTETPARVELITSHHGRTPALLSYVPGLKTAANVPFPEMPLRSPTGKGKPGGGGGGGTTWTDGALQASAPTALTAKNGAAFKGITADGYVPPDTNLSVGPTQIVETTNVQFAVYDKAGTLLLGPAALHTIWANAGLPSTDLCATTDGGDPIVLWDKADGRWIISQLAYNTSVSQNEWCMAVSTGTDATGSYDVYSYQFGSNLPDYPKLGVWQESTGTYSGLYFSANMFANGNSFTGANFCALPLISSGKSLATLTCVQNANAASVLPADMDGTTAAPGGTPGLYLSFSGTNTLNLYQYKFDATNPGGATLSGPTALTVTTFHTACGGGACVPQPGTREKLDSLGDRLMYRLSYRNNSTLGHDALVVNHSVQVSSASAQTGVRWYVIENPGTSPKVMQQSTYSPDASLYRWMGSIAQDKVGNLGLGFSTSSSSAYPGLAFTGRQVGDNVNTMESQATIFTGAGSQTRATRWGDYSSMSVDPADDCTFWYTNEYLTANGTYMNWATYIGSYRFPSCQ